MTPDPPNTSVNAYLRTQVLTASPEQLRLMLLDGAIRFIRQGRAGLAEKNFEASYDGFTKCRSILIELLNSMRPDVDPDLCARVSGLYTFIYQVTVEASLEKDIAKADKAIQMLDFERETWVLAMDKLTEERRREASGDGEAAPAATATKAERRALSIQG